MVTIAEKLRVLWYVLLGVCGKAPPPCSFHTILQAAVYRVKGSLHHCSVDQPKFWAPYPLVDKIAVNFCGHFQNFLCSEKAIFWETHSCCVAKRYGIGLYDFYEII